MAQASARRGCCRSQWSGHAPGIEVMRGISASVESGSASGTFALGQSHPFRRNHPIYALARLANSMNYSLRPHLANAAEAPRAIAQKRSSCETFAEVP
jgi:hypothetical protein